MNLLLNIEEKEKDEPVNSKEKDEKPM